MTTAVKAPPLSEKLFQRQVLELAKIMGWRVYHPFLSKWSERGFPDLTMVRARDRRLLFAELKAEAGRLTPAQVEWQELLAAVAWPRCTCSGPLGGITFGAQRTDDGRLHDSGCAAIGGAFSGLGPRIEVVVWRPSDWDAIQETLR